MSITLYDVLFVVRSHYEDEYYDKEVTLEVTYGADDYDAVVNLISDDIENDRIDAPEVLNSESPTLPIHVSVEYVRIVNEYQELEYQDEESEYV